MFSLGKSFGFAWCVVVWCVVCGVADAKGKRIETGKVRVLDVESFEHDTQASTGATTGDWFVKFYAPWCGHCKSLAPVWDGLAAELKKKVTVAKVDVTKNRLLGTRFSISSFPTLLFFSQGKMYRYKGGRSLKKLKKFALGGFKEGFEALDVPPEPSVFLSVLMGLFEQYTNLLKDNILLAMAILVGISFLLAVTLVVLFICFCEQPQPAGKTKESERKKDK